MSSDFLKDWAYWIILKPDKDLRGNSKHQKQIIKLQGLIGELSETGSVEKARELVQVAPIKCRGETPFVAHCRYLQYCVAWLKDQDFIRLNEGPKDNIKT